VELERIGGRRVSAGELTPSERRVADLVLAGKTNREIATELFVTVHTVEKTLTRAFARLGVRSRTELARRLADQKAMQTKK
jgi:DNA-binding CsgD family transcriptional regulator